MRRCEETVIDLVNGGGTRLKALKLPHAKCFAFVVHDDLFRHTQRLARRYSADKTDREAFGVFEGDDMSAAGSVFHFFNPLTENFDIGDFGGSATSVSQERFHRFAIETYLTSSS